MSLYLNFNIKQSDNARELAFTETTGTYNGSTNLGGWGTPNPAIADVTTSARLSITPPGGTATIINVSTTHPTVDKTVEVVIRSQDLGLGTDIILPDQTIFVSGQARCCVYGLLADIDISCCDCDGSDMARALEAFTYYRAAIACAACGNTSKFTDALGIVNNYCDIKCKCD